MSLSLSSCLALFVVVLAPLSYSSAQTTLTIAAAADLTNIAPRLGTEFEKTNPLGIKADPGWVRFVNEASAVIAQQIDNGAPYDLFLSANSKYIEDLAAKGKLLPNSVRTYAVGQVGILWKDNKRHPLNDLAQNWVRFVALPNPKLAPYGVAAQQALEKAGIWSVVQPKVVYGENVRQTLQLFDSGNADVVLTSGALLTGRDAETLPADSHQPIIQKAGIVAGSSHQELARKFLDFLLSPAGQKIFADFGFGPPRSH